jgi:hypothetical protein
MGNQDERGLARINLGLLLSIKVFNTSRSNPAIKKKRIRPANPSMRSEQGLADWAG